MSPCLQRNLGGRASGVAVRFGVLCTGVAILGALLAFELEQAAVLGWLLALPVAAGAYGLISGTLGICIYHGIRGERGADHGVEAVLDHESRVKMCTRAVFAVTASLAIGGAIAAAFVASV